MFIGHDFCFCELPNCGRVFQIVKPYFLLSTGLDYISQTPLHWHDHVTEFRPMKYEWK